MYNHIYSPLYPVSFPVGFSGVTRDEREHLEQEVLQYREQVSALQDRLDSVTKVRELNNKLLNRCSTHQPLIFSVLSCIWHVS